MFTLLLDLIIRRYIIEFKVSKVIFDSIRFDFDNSIRLEVIKASQHDYLSTITELQINSQYSAVFMNGRLQLHMVFVVFLSSISR